MKRNDVPIHVDRPLDRLIDPAGSSPAFLIVGHDRLAKRSKLAERLVFNILIRICLLVIVSALLIWLINYR